MKVTFELTEKQAYMLLAHARNEGIRAQEYLERISEFCFKYMAGTIPKPVKTKIEETKQKLDMWAGIYLKLEEHHEHL